METFSALLAICAGNSPVHGEVPAQRPVTRSFDVFFDLRSNKRLSKQWRGWWFERQLSPLWRHRNERLSKQGWGWWFETPLRPSWRHCNDLFCYVYFIFVMSTLLGECDPYSSGSLQWRQMSFVRLKLPTTQLFVPQFANIKWNIKVLYYLPFLRSPVDFPHERPVMRKTFPCHHERKPFLSSGCTLTVSRVSLKVTAKPLILI